MMTDVHCHISSGDASIREWLIGREFVGVHPWSDAEPEKRKGTIGVGEIGLDRLRCRVISDKMRANFLKQLEFAAEVHCPVVLHGAKCWGEVYRECLPFAKKIPSFLFHGFSRSAGLLEDIKKIGGFISVGPAVLNDHAVNYREMVKTIPEEMLLLETDRTEEKASCCLAINEVARETARLMGKDIAELEKLTDDNADRFAGL